MSDSITEVKRSPLLGEHTEEILRKVLGYSAKEIAEIKASGAITPPEKTQGAKRRSGLTRPTSRGGCRPRLRRGQVACTGCLPGCPLLARARE